VTPFGHYSIRRKCVRVAVRVVCGCVSRRVSLGVLSVGVRACARVCVRVRGVRVNVRVVSVRVRVNVRVSCVPPM
jgi:hypothetical protein